jgi:hypothetical protein
MSRTPIIDPNREFAGRRKFKGNSRFPRLALHFANPLH